MNKSVPAFTIGLIFSILGGIFGYVFWILFVLVSTTQKGITQNLLNILPIINMVTFAVSLVGSIFCLFKQKIGGIILLVSSLTSIICLITLFILLKSFTFVLFLFSIPTIFIFVSSLIALKQK